LKWLKRAADQHHWKAQFNLNKVFRFGEGVQKDDNINFITDEAMSKLTNEINTIHGGEDDRAGE
jgi:TPR repeat protein